jgi:methylated-DNA-[protein]-cysteine S-methyltransferase
LEFFSALDFAAKTSPDDLDFFAPLAFMKATLSRASMPDRRLDVEQTFVCSTTLGWIAVALRGAAVQRLVFGHTTAKAALWGLGRDESRRGETARPASELARDLAARLEAYADGELDEFRDVEIADDGLTTFGRAVVARCRAIPYGQTRSYGQLAALAGRPGAARAVGQVMATNRVPLIVPCHRVVAAGGLLGGFSAPQGLSMKRRLLALEASH